MSKEIYKLSVELLDNYKQLRNIRSDFLSRKYRPLLQSQLKYKLFDFEHPYQEMDIQTKNVIKSFERMLKLMLDVEIDGSSFRNELNKMTTMLILKDKSDATIERVRKL